MDTEILDELVRGILAIIGQSAVRIILYGSVARGTNTDESDVDVAVLIKDKLDDDKEEKLSDFVVDMNLKYDKVFSVIGKRQFLFIRTYQKKGSYYGKYLRV